MHSLISNGLSALYYLMHRDKVKEKNLLLDPLTSLARVASLNYMTTCTKISIGNNHIAFIQPTVLQGTIRWGYGDTRNDLHNLFNPILRATEWYDGSITEVRFLFEKAADGITVLKLAYDPNSIISHTLDHYINTIKQFLHTTQNPSACIEAQPNKANDVAVYDHDQDHAHEHDTDHSHVAADYDEDDTDEYYNEDDAVYANYEEHHVRENSETAPQKDAAVCNAKDLGMMKTIYKPMKDEQTGNTTIHQLLQGLWSFRRVQTLYNLFLDLDDLVIKNKIPVSDKEVCSTLKAVDTILSAKEEMVGALVKHHATIL
jgi:hypothetical protein